MIESWWKKFQEHSDVLFTDIRELKFPAHIVFWDN